MCSRSWGARARMRGRDRRGLPRAGLRFGAAPQRRRAALRRGLPPSPGVPHARGPARSGRTGPSRRRRLLLFPPPPPSAARSALLRLQPRWLSPNLHPPTPHPRGPGRRQKAPPSPPRCKLGGAAARRGLRGGRARARERASERGACAATALQRLPRPLLSGAEGPSPTRVASCRPRVNELDLESFEGRGFPCTPSIHAHSPWRARRGAHTQRPPPNSVFRQGVGGEEVEAKAVQTMETKKVNARDSTST